MQLTVNLFKINWVKNELIGAQKGRDYNSNWIISLARRPAEVRGQRPRQGHNLLLASLYPSFSSAAPSIKLFALRLSPLLLPRGGGAARGAAGSPPRAARSWGGEGKGLEGVVGERWKMQSRARWCRGICLSWIHCLRQRRARWMARWTLSQGFD